jgi:hypothetical protein
MARTLDSGPKPMELWRLRLVTRIGRKQKQKAAVNRTMERRREGGGGEGVLHLHGLRGAPGRRPPDLHRRRWGRGGSGRELAGRVKASRGKEGERRRKNGGGMGVGANAPYRRTGQVGMRGPGWAETGGFHMGLAQVAVQYPEQSKALPNCEHLFL